MEDLILCFYFTQPIYLLSIYWSDENVWVQRIRWERRVFFSISFYTHIFAWEKGTMSQLSSIEAGLCL